MRGKLFDFFFMVSLKLSGERNLWFKQCNQLNLNTEQWQQKFKLINHYFESAGELMILSVHLQPPISLGEHFGIFFLKNS